MQPEKAFFPIDVTVLGMVTVCSPTQPLNAAKPIALMVFGMTVFAQPVIRVPLLVSMIALQSPVELYFSLPSSTMMLSRLGQLEKGFVPIDVTDFGIETEVKDFKL